MKEPTFACQNAALDIAYGVKENICTITHVLNIFVHFVKKMITHANFVKE